MGYVAYFLFYKTMVDAHFLMIFLFVCFENELFLYHY